MKFKAGDKVQIDEALHAFGDLGRRGYRGAGKVLEPADKDGLVRVQTRPGISIYVHETDLASR